MPTGRVFAEWLKDLKEKKGVSACRYRYVFPEGYFPAETFHNAYPSAGMPTGRVFAEWLKDLKEKKGVSACRYRYEKNNRSNF